MGKYKKKIILLCTVFISIVLYHFRLDIFSPSLEHAPMESSLLISDEAKSQVILLKEAPLLMDNRRAKLKSFFGDIPLWTLCWATGTI